MKHLNEQALQNIIKSSIQNCETYLRLLKDMDENKNYNFDDVCNFYGYAQAIYDEQFQMERQFQFRMGAM